jgi:hypothetical protein
MRKAEYARIQETPKETLFDQLIPTQMDTVRNGEKICPIEPWKKKSNTHTGAY